ncbi:dNA-binding helix-turn-helix protein [Clostridium sp. CAG:149]|nr:dNA-binding helix-turn-helix protein [Clostridium sp. CAG:149]
MESRLESSFTELLRVEGINFKGFGILPKYVMLDDSLSIEAKSIYAYLCSYAGNGSTSFPSRDTILRELGIGKDAYYNHFRQLTVQGYITVRQEIKSGLKGRNIYTLVSSPSKFTEDCSKINCIRFTGLKAAGYGLIPKAIMTDPRLPLKAKGIYAYFCSFTGSGNTAFPRRDMILRHLNITEPTYYKFYKLLLELNYVTVIQRHIDGKLGVNDYYLNDTPDMSKATTKLILVQDLKKPDAVVQDLKNPDTAVQDLKNQDIVKQDLKKQNIVNPDTNINRSTINNSIINNPSIIQERRRDLLNIKKQVKEKMQDSHSLPYEYAAKEDYMRAAIYYLAEWETLHGYGDELEQRIYDLFVEALVQMCCSSSGSGMHLTGSYVTYAQVIDKINQRAKFGKNSVDISDFKDVAMENYHNAAIQGEIRNPLKYMESCIWNALITGSINLYAHFKRNF